MTASLDTNLKESQIAVQAYRGRSFVGNHCHKCLQPRVIANICQSVVRAIQQQGDNSKGPRYMKTILSLEHVVFNCTQDQSPMPISQKLIKAHISYTNHIRKYFLDTTFVPKQHI